MLVTTLLAALALSSGSPASSATHDRWTSDGASVRLVSHRNRLALRVDEGGLEVRASNTNSEPLVRVRTTTIGRVGALVDLGAGTLSVAPDRVELLRAGLVESFVDRSGGVEQGWIVLDPPAGPRDANLWIGVVFEGLFPQIADDGLSARLVDERADPRLWYRDLRAWDATGRALAARMTTRGGRFGIEVDDEGAAYPLTVDPTLGAATSTFEPDQVGAALQRATPVGRVLGLGTGYLLAAAPDYDDGANVDAGRVWVLAGGALSVAWQSSGPSLPGARFGATIAALGDIDGDGYSDFAVSAPGYSSPEPGEGAIFVYRGQPLGPVLHWTIEGNAPGAALRLGESGYLGDVNGDGLRDLAVLAGSGAAAIEELRIYAGSGAAAPTLLWTLTENDLAPHIVPADASEFTVTGGFDVDADGIDDVALGAPAQFGEIGRAFLLRGFPTAVPTTPPAPVWIGAPPGSPTASRFGGSIAFVGDIDGTGFADLAVGAPRHPGDDTGAVFVFRANPVTIPLTILPVLPSHTLVGAAPGARLGRQVASAGDFDADGYADVLLGSTTPGAEIAIHRGGPAGLEAAATWTQAEFQSGSLFGTGAGPAGDLTDDGEGDVWVCAPAFANGEAGEGILYLFAGRVAPGLVVAPGAGASSFTSSPATGFGTAFALGDVNGDGLQDLLVGSPDWSNGQTSEGRIALYLADETTGFSSTPVWTYESDSVGARLGASVAVVGDVQNDGFEDVLAGAPGWSNGQPGEGRAILFRGLASGALGSTPAWSFESDEAGAELGACVARAGDVDRDALGDVAIGAPGMRAGQADRGAVYVFHGLAVDSLDNLPRVVLDGGEPATRFGSAIAFGDPSRDDYDDLAVGAPARNSGTGSVYVFPSIGFAGLSTTALRYDGAAPGDEFGYALAFNSDVDSNGTSDLAVGAPGAASGGTSPGVVHLYFGAVGTGLPAAPDQTLTGTQHQARFGAALAWAGDLNSDAFGDLLVGSPLHDGAFVDGGRVDVHVGVSTGLATTSAWSLEGSSAGAMLGSWVAGNADFDGDGFSDLAYGIPGTSEILIGSGTTGSSSYYGNQQRRVDDARAVSLLGASEVADGMSFSCTASNPSGRSSTPAGRVDVRLVMNLIDDASFQSTAYADTGIPTSVPIVRNTSRAGLALETAFRWQSRLEYRNPIIPHSRWLGLQGYARRGKKFVTTRDCNSNGVSDLQDIASGASADLNRDNVPDECLPPALFFCLGDGSGTACPCGNASAPGAMAGCRNSLGLDGTLRSVGVPRVTADSFLLLGARMPNSSALFFQGTAQQSAGAGSVLGDGLRCAAGSVLRLGTKVNVGGSSRYPEPGDPPVSVRGLIPAGGATRTYQVWYRNAAPFCTPATFNLSNGLSAVWVP